jgi:hypothetical protein
MVDKVALVQVFSESFGFSCHTFHRFLHTYRNLSSFGAGTIGHLVTSVIVDSVPLQPKKEKKSLLLYLLYITDRLCGLVVRVLGYRFGGPGSIPGTTQKKK